MLCFSLQFVFVQDILDTGFSAEAEAARCDDWYQKM